jgi:tRNA 2-selenouridine synthase SelU
MNERPFFDAIHRMTTEYVRRMREQYMEAQPIGWIVITPAQRMALISQAPPGIDQELLRRSTGAFGSMFGVPLHMASREAKLDQWLYGTFTVDMREVSVHG